ncbi:hypothetical protein AZH53_09515 [Methanomicrobiaceae archaeon CYW5]|uniref:trimeric intracellular cation channel family protein n=1 Tax=Methanovulcanius yangii TaxID=1789227 RepID=UPI0029CA354A|nr:TRIC cation channel family protein [Methanovulcanius yangii]MBT8508641.1 hypothetical protein [Methanovulcanius yangii]
MIEIPALAMIIGVAAFAITGVIAGARQDANIFTVVILGVVTAVGGGTVRDVLLEVPIFWTEAFTLIWVAIAASCIAFFFAKHVITRLARTFLYADAIGVAFFTIAAIDKTLLLGHTATVAVTMGFVTACMGGVVRDLLTGTPPLIIASEDLFVTPAVVGGVLYAVLLKTMPAYVDIWAIVAIGFIIAFRIYAIRTSLQYPSKLRMHF